MFLQPQNSLALTLYTITGFSRLGKKPQKDGAQPILHRYLNSDMYMNAWRRVQLFHFPIHARYKTPSASQAHAASNTGESGIPRNHRAFPPAWLGSVFCLPQIPSAASQSHDLLLGSALTLWPQHLWPVAAFLGKALTNTSGSSHFPPSCPCSLRDFFFSTLMLIMNFFQSQSHITNYPTHNQPVQYFSLATKACYLYPQHKAFYLQSLPLFLLEIRLKGLETGTGAAFVALQWGALVYTVLSYGGCGGWTGGVWTAQITTAQQPQGSS